ncbi:hypothetical protein KUTeg_020956 [Tegillarca granosa]|uniref:Uncharacterized protein n=1 Tax=Tegillarca granosa TaxID=220873 RepID=A0ABQ9E9E3_TEGGR|nr:hypothetical protein KUTeg_020956 [Tegillarca granosa]
MSQAISCTNGCSNTFKKEFQIRNFYLGFNQPRLFVLSQCGHQFLYPLWNNNPGTLAKHVFNSVFTIVNISLSAMPVRLLHFYQPVLFGLVYLIFSLIFQLGFNNSAIYPILDWTNLSFTIPIALCLLLVALPLFHLLFYVFYQLRVYIAYRCCNKTSRSIERDSEFNIFVSFLFVFLMTLRERIKTGLQNCNFNNGHKHLLSCKEHLGLIVKGLFLLANSLVRDISLVGVIFDLGN